MRRFSELFLFIAGLLLWACEAPRLPFEEGKPKLVVFSEFNNNQILQVQVARSRSIVSDNGRQEYVLDAVVDLYREGEYLETLRLDDRAFPPVYTTRELVPEANVTYTIRVEAPGFDPAWAENYIPAGIRINSLSVTDLRLQPDPASGAVDYSYRVHIQFADPPSELNYYHLNFFQEILPQPDLGDGGMSSAPRKVKVAFSDINQGLFIPSQNGGVLFSDDTFDGQDFTQIFPLSFKLQAAEKLGQLLVELRAVSEAYYLFQTTVTRQQGPGVPVQGEVIIYNNIENGQGIFAGYNSSVDSIQVVF